MLKKNIETENLIIKFTESSALPDEVIVKAFDKSTFTLIPKNTHTLELSLDDGRTIIPGGGKAMLYNENGAQCVEFTSVPGKNKNTGEIVDFIKFSFKHEFYDDGTAFTTAFLMLTTNDTPKIIRNELTINADFTNFDDLRYAVFERFSGCDSTVIQALNNSRYIAGGEPRSFGKGIFPLAGFNAFKTAGQSQYTEFFVEGGNSVSGIALANSSSVNWKNNLSPELSWNFQHGSATGKIWKNRWGWVIRPAATKRLLPPYRMYHFLDNTTRYPTEEELDAMICAGMDVLVIHENWRFDAQNGGVPFDEDAFRSIVAKAHENNIRIAVYIRGNETSVHEDACSWFKNYLRYDFDGLYMDYGGPFCEVTTPDEYDPDGRVLFREHYLKLKRLRETIGPNGVFYSHTGPFYSALGMSFMNGYTSGEGERGLMIKGRKEHEYYSMAAVSPGTMWTAAFPEYSSKNMVPFLASTGQYPHIPLGEQFQSSSLVHPRVPGINDHNFQPLLKLWSLFKGEKDIRIFNDYNSSNVFQYSAEIGHYLMISRNNKRALLILSNFSDNELSIEAQVDWSKIPDVPSNSKIIEFDSADTALVRENDNIIKLQSFGVAGILYTEMAEQICFPNCIAPEKTVSGKEYLTEIKKQKELRTNPWPCTSIKIVLPYPATTTSYEKSLIDDLFDCRYKLVEIIDGGIERVLGWFGKSSFEQTPPDEYPTAVGEESCLVKLDSLLTPGKHNLLIRSIHAGEPFYCFVKAVLYDNQNNEYCIKFYNALETDRSQLTFQVFIPEK